ncbi:OsmC family protein [Emticicia sp. C21]|uniref:OsmC family protein n=1 Tax=Emticicia sp. C21 TaxID=2302915 RepID=UPI000E343A65|nr:OsmC family protein [Emticicia sp. C21]RFS16517.1 OsmC family peroxiredoxin [Emticicia sp. C21]
MTISATIKNTVHENIINVVTNGNEQNINIPVKASGRGSAVNGGELLFLSLATCFCNDIYREAARRQMEIENIEVSVSGEFGKEGEPASNITYEVSIEADNHSPVEIAELINHVDTLAEVHNTLRQGVSVKLKL